MQAKLAEGGFKIDAWHDFLELLQFMWKMPGADSLIWLFVRQLTGFL